MNAFLTDGTFVAVPASKRLGGAKFDRRIEFIGVRAVCNVYALCVLCDVCGPCCVICVCRVLCA